MIKFRINELDLGPEDPLSEIVNQFSALTGQIQALESQLEGLKKQHAELQTPISEALLQLDKMGDDVEKVIRVGETVISFKQRPHEKDSVSYGKVFDLLYEKLDKTLQELAMGIKATQTKRSAVKGTLKVNEAEGSIESSLNSFIDKAEALHSIVDKLESSVKSEEDDDWEYSKMQKIAGIEKGAQDAAMSQYD